MVFRLPSGRPLEIDQLLLLGIYLLAGRRFFCFLCNFRGTLCVLFPGRRAFLALLGTFTLSAVVDSICSLAILPFAPLQCRGKERGNLIIFLVSKF
jgi:hypothetical protein